jgi:hypothetical protein
MISGMKRNVILLFCSVFMLACGGISTLAREASCEKFGERAVTVSDMAGTYSRDDDGIKPIMLLDASGTFSIQNAACLSGKGSFTLDNNQLVLKHEVLKSGCVVTRLPVLTACQVPGGALEIMQEDVADPDEWTVWARQ